MVNGIIMAHITVTMDEDHVDIDVHDHMDQTMVRCESNLDDSFHMATLYSNVFPCCELKYIHIHYHIKVYVT